MMGRRRLLVEYMNNPYLAFLTGNEDHHVHAIVAIVITESGVIRIVDFLVLRAAFTLYPRHAYVEYSTFLFLFSPHAVIMLMEAEECVYEMVVQQP
jgi:hypothetical protein